MFEKHITIKGSQMASPDFFDLHIATVRSLSNSKRVSLSVNILGCLSSVQGVPHSKPLGDFKVDSAFHLFVVNLMSTRISWDLTF